MRGGAQSRGRGIGAMRALVLLAAVALCGTTHVCAAHARQAAPRRLAACNDNIHNGDESDVDCGGSCLAKCGNGKSCQSFNDCASTLCGGGRCYGKLARARCGSCNNCCVVYTCIYVLC